MADPLSEKLDIDRQSLEKFKRQTVIDSTTIDYTHWFAETIKPRHGSTIIETRSATGSSMIWNSSTYGVWNTDKWDNGSGFTSFAVVGSTNRQREFLDAGKNQIRDFLVGSSAAIKPVFIAIGSGTTAWDATQSGLITEMAKATITSYSGNGAQNFQVQAIFDMDDFVGSINEILVSGGKAFIRDVLSSQIIKPNTDEMRITVTGWVGS